jgi:DNA-binding transcriptional MerR regulator/methylmalonyl-CoA mutase cobalamin-binding subunit
MPFSTSPAFNLKVVLKETGLAADTLRAWERRYGIPLPERTPGGHRLYSQRDIETIKWLMARQTEGLSISRAVDLWNEQSASGTDPLAGAASRTDAAPPALLLPANTSLDALRSEWINACLKFDESAAEHTLNQAFSMFPVEAVCTTILQRALSELGELWYENRASVQQEHFASALAMRRLDALLAASPAPSRKQTVIVGCPADEWHAFTPLLLALLLRRRGLGVIYLGANVPNVQFAETAAAVRADLVILVAQTLVTAATLQQVAQTLTSRGLPTAFGGRIFNVIPSLVESIPGHFLGRSVEASLDEVDRLTQSNGAAGAAKPISQEYLAAHQFFASRRAEIELSLRQHIQPLAVSPDSLMTGIVHLGNNIEAALQLGDMNYVSGEMEWVKSLVKAHDRPMSELTDFITSYANAVRQHINGSGRPIFDWLSSEVVKLQTEGTE